MLESEDRWRGKKALQNDDQFQQLCYSLKKLQMFYLRSSRSTNEKYENTWSEHLKITRCMPQHRVTERNQDNKKQINIEREATKENWLGKCEIQPENKHLWRGARYPLPSSECCWRAHVAVRRDLTERGAVVVVNVVPWLWLCSLMLPLGSLMIW